MSKVSFYIASRLENAEQVKEVSAVLTSAGHIHTYDWTEHGSVPHEDKDRISEVAMLETQGVLDADLVVVILTDEPGGRGTHAELGIAIGKDKSIIICAPDDAAFHQDGRTCAFYWHKNVVRVTGQPMEWMSEIFRCISRLSDKLERGY